MGKFAELIGRGLDLITCNTDEFISKFEDPVKVSRMAIQEAKENYVNLKSKSATVLGTVNRLKSKMEEYEEEASNFHTIALNALKSGDEESSKAALATEQKYKGLAQDVRAEYEEAKVEADGIKADLEELLGTISDMEKRAVKVESQMARAQVKKQTQTIKSGFNGVGTDKLKRAEEKAEKELSEADALKELSKPETRDRDQEKSLKSKYGSGPSTSVDSAFEALKAELQ